MVYFKVEMFSLIEFIVLRRSDLPVFSWHSPVLLFSIGASDQTINSLSQ